MERYGDFRPTPFDSNENFIAFDSEGLDSIEGWFIVLGRNRDSDILTESNFDAALKSLGGEGDDVQVHRFGHWACGWYELLLVRPDTKACKRAEEIESALSDYPVLDDEDLSEREQEEADRIWRDCYSVKERIAYIRENRTQFEFRSFATLMSCVRGDWFGGYAREFIQP